MYHHSMFPRFWQNLAKHPSVVWCYSVKKTTHPIRQKKIEPGPAKAVGFSLPPDPAKDLGALEAPQILDDTSMYTSVDETFWCRYRRYVYDSVYDNFKEIVVIFQFQIEPHFPLRPSKNSLSFIEGFSFQPGGMEQCIGEACIPLSPCFPFQAVQSPKN